MLISEVARLSGMTKDGVRHYEEMGLIGSSPRPAGSRMYRDYPASVLQTIDQVRQAQRLGFTLSEIGPLLKAYAEAPPTKEETVAFLHDRLAVIRTKQRELADVEDFIRAKIARYAENPAAPTDSGAGCATDREDKSLTRRSKPTPAIIRARATAG